MTRRANADTPEQVARDMIERATGDDSAQSLSAGDVVELANMIAAVHDAYRLATSRGTRISLLEEIARVLRPYTGAR